MSRVRWAAIPEMCKRDATEQLPGRWACLLPCCSSSACKTSERVQFKAQMVASRTATVSRRTSRPAHWQTGGPAGQRTSGPADQRTGGPADRRTSGPADQRTSGHTVTAWHFGSVRYANLVTCLASKPLPGIEAACRAAVRCWHRPVP